MFKVLTKADFLLLILLVAIGLALSWVSLSGSVRGQTAVVTVNGREYGRYSLSRDQSVTIRQNGHTNKFSIKNGHVQMTYSDCKNQLCVEHSSISRTNQSIVCLPNRVVIEIRGGDGYDAVSN
ncbi:hypothetical protein BHK98_10085 [Hornefia porci]|uniref:Uncharacterized protein n=1 Tax=Hornefia porci TaxID=2652292 RepID=A0A1Q9JJS1_9FIRM|nr:NusG domain II-containing protein [Hornefia porci]OLR56387.1 hypothetical protein BHK98_10085 [Hornefia porci]